MLTRVTFTVLFKFKFDKGSVQNKYIAGIKFLLHSTS